MKTSAYRKAIESLYKDTCKVLNMAERDRADGSTGFGEMVVCENMPCRLSYKTIQSASPTDDQTKVSQEIKLFIAPELQIEPGSKVIISRTGQTIAFEASGEPAVYETHQEILLTLAKEHT